MVPQARCHIEGHARVEVHIVRHGHITAARTPGSLAAVAAKVKVLETAGLPVKHTGHAPPRRHQHVVLCHRQVALGCDPAAGKADHVWLIDLDRARAVVAPEHLAGPGIDRVDVDALDGPDTSTEIDDAVTHRGPTAHDPTRDHAPVADDLFSVRACAQLPEQLAVRSRQAIQEPVVAPDKDAALPRAGREADRPASEEAPFLFTRARVQSVQLVVRAAAYKAQPTGGDHAVGPIELHARAREAPADPCPMRLVPCTAQPVECERNRQRLGRVTTPRSVAPVLGPVRRRAGPCTQEGCNSDKKESEPCWGH